MVMKWMKQLVVPGALLATTCGLTAQAQEAVLAIEEGGSAGPQGTVVANVVEIETTVEEAGTTGAGEATAESGFWLGLACEPINDVLKAQLNIQQGLWVRDVIAEGPAAKSNIQAFDVLLKLDEEDLGEVEQLVTKVEKSDGKELTIKLLRGGKEQVFRITPVARPKIASFGATIAAESGTPWKKVEAEFKKLRENHKDFEMLIVRPGVAFPADRVTTFALPKDATIKINKQGDKPAEITIKLGEKSWTVTEDKLDGLPPEARVLAERMRGGATVHWQNAPGADNPARAFFTPGAPGTMTLRAIPVPPGGMPHGVPATPPQMAIAPTTTARVAIAPGVALPHNQLDDVNRKLDAIIEHMKQAGDVAKLQAQVDKLHKEVEELRKSAK